MLILYTPNRSTDSHLGTQWLRDSSYILHIGHQRVTEGAQFMEALPSNATPSGVCSLLRQHDRGRKSCRSPVSDYISKLHVSCAHNPLARTSYTAFPKCKVRRKHPLSICAWKEKNRIWVQEVSTYMLLKNKKSLIYYRQIFM